MTDRCGAIPAQPHLTSQTLSGFLVPMGTGDDDALSAQLVYYDLRAGEYDDELYRSPQTSDRIELVLSELAPTGRALELACGTGVWTEQLATRVESLTAVDGSRQMLAIARKRLGDTPVTLLEANLFDWQPDDRYDTIFFAFWLSHVPPNRFDAFWASLRTGLVSGGRVLFVDTGPAEEAYEAFVPGSDVPMVARQLKDGSRHMVVKMLYDPTDLATRLGAMGWTTDIAPVGETLYAGSATPI
jgi:SAM-dependent methyltransferase